MLPQLPWHEWICHTNFSFCIGASHPEEYVREAHSLGYKGLGICDYDGIYGIVRAHKEQARIERPPQLYYGVELHLAADYERPLLFRDTIVLYALNLQGYRTLCRLISQAHETGKREAVLSLNSLLACSPKDIVCLQPMRGLIRRAPLDMVAQRYALLKEHFGSHYHLILSRHLNPSEDAWIQHTQGLSKHLNIPLLFSQDSFFHNSERKELSDILQAIRLRQTVDEAMPHLFVNAERSFRPLETLAARYLCFAQAEQIIYNSQELAERFCFSLNELRYHYPQEFLPEGYTSQSFLEEITWQSAEQHYGLLPDTLRRLLQRELTLVKDLGFADYFLTVWDIVRWARSQNILCQGRGSAANSAICYVLGITAVNPCEFDVLFERFISKERGDPPDIDVDFEHERREEVIQYIYQRYGRARAAMVANVITFRHRSALRCTGKALGISEALIEQLAPQKGRSSYHQKAAPQQNITVDPASSPQDPPLCEEVQEIPWELWDRLAQSLKGFPHHLGIHSGGFVITQEPIETFCAQEPATMEGRTVIQWSKDDIESLCFFKIDILALGMLTALRKALHLISQHANRGMQLTDIPPDDPATYAMIQKGETIGTFQIESRAQMAMLPRLKPRTLYDLVIQIGIIRPGPIQGGLIHPYLKRRQGLEPIVYPDPRLEPILRRTLGVPIFQEQVMRIAISVGDFSAGEADQLRKHIGAWSLNKEWGPLVQRLESGMHRNGIKPHFIQQLLDHLKGFANYGFPESHAVSFALLAYASAYIKCHYREIFYTALLNSQPLGFYSVHALVQSARREGCSFLPLDITQSDWDTRYEQHSFPDGSAVSFIRLGLRLVKGLSTKTATHILKQRERTGPWSSLHEFLLHTNVPIHELAALAAANVFHCFDIDRPQAIWLVAAGRPAPLLDQEEALQLPQEQDLRQIEQDFEHFGTTLHAHPCQIIREQHWMYPIASQQISRAEDLAKTPAGRSVMVFGLLLMRQQPETAKGMVFLTLEDETGLINLALTPDAAEKWASSLERQAFLCVRGKLQKQSASHSILVDMIFAQEWRDKNIVALRRDQPEAESRQQQKKKIKPHRIRAHGVRNHV